MRAGRPRAWMSTTMSCPPDAWKVKWEKACGVLRWCSSTKPLREEERGLGEAAEEA